MAPFLVKRITESERESFFKAYTVLVISTSVLVLSFLVWMTRN